MKRILFATCLLVLTPVFAQQSGHEAFLRQQAYAEMQRAMSQLDTLQNNFDNLERRVSKLEHGSNTQALQAEIDSLRAAVAELRKQLAAQRGEIVKDISGRIAAMQPKETPKPKETKEKKTAVTGPTMTYEVKNGDSLYLIAMAFNTTVAKLREMNNLKKDSILRPGQKLIVPQVK